MNYLEYFEEDLGKIEKLISAPNLIREHILNNLKNINFDKLENTEKTKLNNSIKSIENISNESFKNEFKIIYNQVCILAVSSLSANIEKYFKDFIIIPEVTIGVKNLEKIKLNLQEILQYRNINFENLGDIILEKDNSINFQDLQSTIRSFNEYLGKNIKLGDGLRNKIIFYQQCRNVLVHKNGLVDDNFVKKTNKESNIKEYKTGDIIQLDFSDWISMKNSFLEFYKKIVN